jgi:hypothetical protein
MKDILVQKISIEEYNEACKKTVMRYTDVWNDEKMGWCGYGSVCDLQTQIMEFGGF